MGMDKNTVIGFLLLGLLFIGYIFYNSQGKQAFEKQQQHIKDSIERLKPKIDTSLNALKNSNSSNTKKDSSLVNIKQDTSGKETFFTLENKVLKITFTNKGGQPKKVELKDFKTFDKKPLILQDGNFSNISYAINTGNNETVQTSDLLFTSPGPQISGDGKETITFSLQSKDGNKIEHQYTLNPGDYMVGFNIIMGGADKLVTQNTLNQQFFASSIIAKNKFENADLNWEVPADTGLHIIGKLTANMRIKVSEGP